MTNLSGIWWLETGLGKSEWRVFSCTWTLETKTGRLGRPQVTGTMETFERAGDTILVTITFARQKLDHAILVTFLKGDLIKVSVLICKLWTFSGSHCGNGPKLVANWCQEYASASVGSEMQPSPENNHPVHFFLETADLGVTAGLRLEVIVDEGCPGQSILLAENTNQDGQATGDMLELAPRQGHELTSPIPIQSWRFLQSSSPTRTRTLSSPWPRWCPTFPSLHPPYEWRINSLVRTFEDILSLFDLTIDTISFQAILNSLQMLERPWPNVLLILLNYNILLYRYFYFNKSI